MTCTGILSDIYLPGEIYKGNLSLLGQTFIRWNYGTEMSGWRVKGADCLCLLQRKKAGMRFAVGLILREIPVFIRLLLMTGKIFG